MKPACEIEEYARSRFTRVWTSAARLPHASDAQARKATAIVQTSSFSGNATLRRRSVSTSATALVAAAMNPVTGVGAPS